VQASQQTRGDGYTEGKTATPLADAARIWERGVIQRCLREQNDIVAVGSELV